MFQPTGQARITPAFALPASHVVHTVGPVWRGGEHAEARLLASCYQESLQLAALNGITSIAFPAISCGVYGYPAEQAVDIAVREVRRKRDDHAFPDRVLFCCFGSDMLALYESVLAEQASG